MILVLSIFAIFSFLSWFRPDLTFWIAVLLFLDPGGFLFVYIDRSMIGGLQLSDVTMALLIIPLISPKVRIKHFFKYKDNRWIFLFLSGFAVLYQILIFGYIAPGLNGQSLIQTLQYQRLDIWGFLVIIPVYIFFRRSYSVMIKIAMISSAILAALYLLRLAFNIPLLPVWTHARGLGIDATRISMYSYGFAYWFIFIATICILFKFTIPKRGLIYFIGLTIIIAVVLTLTRRSILLLLYSLLLVYLFSQIIRKQSLISWRFVRPLVLMIVVVVSINLIAPRYLGYSISLMQNTFQMINYQNDDDFQVDGRLESDIPNHLNRFRQSPIIGYGYDALWYSNNNEEGGLSANDVPLTAALGMFGILGIGIFSLYYFRIFGILFKSFKLLRKTYFTKLDLQRTIIFIILFALVTNFIAKYSISFFSLFSDLVDGTSRVTNMLYIGMLLASRDMMKEHLAISRKMDLTSYQYRD